MKRADLTGRVFGRLTVVGYSRAICRPSVGRHQGRPYHYWNCLCVCGAIVEVIGDYLKSGTTSSCGCYAVDVTKAYFTTHGRTETPEYRIWTGILTRCTNPNVKCFRLYGGRGITICERWKDFANFYADMGDRPSSIHSIDRYPNRNGNYEPRNARWATPQQQANNQDRNTIIEFAGERLTLSQWSERTGLTRCSISQRLRSGWPIVEVLTARSRSTSGQRLKAVAAKRTPKERSDTILRGWETRRARAALAM